MRLPRLRRGPRPRSADDDDWGTSSPAAIMDSAVPAPLPPKPSAFARLKQQELSSYTCTFSPRSVITLYFVIAFVFIPFGSAIVAGTSRIRTSGRLTYSVIDGCNITDIRQPKQCIVKVPVNESIPAPSYLYYHITNFYQNARKYAKSRSDVMNQGIVPSAFFDVENCEPWLFKDPDTGGDNGFNASEFIYPCGLTARSYFNDTLQLCHDEDCERLVDTSSEGIALWTDVNHKFNPGDDPLFQGKPNRLLSSEDFIVWMRLSAFSDFDKLYRIVNEELTGNTTYYMRINSNYPVNEFGGTKGFHITTVQWFGASNPFLGTAYLVVGIAALFIAVTLLVKHILNPRSPAVTDPAMLLREHLAKLDVDLQHPLPQPLPQ